MAVSMASAKKSDWGDPFDDSLESRACLSIYLTLSRVVSKVLSISYCGSNILTDILMISLLLVSMVLSVKILFDFEEYGFGHFIFDTDNEQFPFKISF